MRPKHPISLLHILKLLLQGALKGLKVPVLAIVHFLQRIRCSSSFFHSQGPPVQFFRRGEDEAGVDSGFRKHSPRDSRGPEDAFISTLDIDLVMPSGILQDERDGAYIEREESQYSACGPGDAFISTLDIYPIMPSGILRDERDGAYIEPEESQYSVKSMQINFNNEPALPEGWTKMVQPEGFPFFWHEQNRIITDSWIYEADIHGRLMGYIENIQADTRARDLLQTKDVNLVLQIVLVENIWRCEYYFVNHSTRTIFWIEEFDISRFITEVKGKIQSSHIKVFMENEYWHHWSLYPNLCRVTSEVMTLTENALRDAITDMVTSDYSTVGVSLERLKEHLALVQDTKAALPPGYLENKSMVGARYCETEVSTWCIGRIMKSIGRFLNFYGQRVCRLSTHTSVYRNHGPKTAIETSMRFRFLSPALFYAPDVYYSLMENMWVDKLTVLELWKKLFAQLQKDWRDHLIHASLLLTSNIAFLSISNVTKEDDKMQGTLIQIPSYVSTISSIGSIILGLLLIRQHELMNPATAADIHKFIKKRYHENRGFEPLAIVYSLPYALLMWG
ncbi:hypothetical protein FA15DRAFT_759286 [Coprinopsis marcescibilis]|uniref:WW domain-containing protein n=1 Tax=Coprinopsis marcescibilis TaxID=230819 RepID=A0A5C3KK08_COPMA|nr:hypothetical protein FA15DRAFT_759286 [Coprinopsis marcescibilis]